MESRNILLDGQVVVTITLPSGTPETQWQVALSAYLLPPGDQTVEPASDPDGDD